MDNYNIKVWIFCIGLFCSSWTFGQNRFSASAFAGLTAAQLGGDSLSGYDKMGFTFGLKLAYPLSKKIDLNTELLFSQRGSRSTFGFGANGNNYTLLNYIEIPVYLTLNDWYIEKDKYHKTGIFAGLSYAYLFTAETNNTILESRTAEFNKNDISARVGVYFAFNKHLVFSTYYTDAFSKIIQGELFNTNSLDSFFWTFRIEYKF